MMYVKYPRIRMAIVFSKFRVVIGAFLILGGFCFSDAALAEGGCPPGQYPIGDSRAPGCAPIPASGSESAGPRPTGRWIKTWGAIALSPDGASGAATGRRSKSVAAKDAEGVCTNAGGKACKVAFTFKNQCAAAAVPSAGEGGTSFARSADEATSKELALKECRSGGGLECRTVYSACSEPEFEAF